MEVRFDLFIIIDRFKSSGLRIVVRLLLVGHLRLLRHEFPLNGLQKKSFKECFKTLLAESVE